MGAIQATRARLHAGRLDDELAHGADPFATGDLAARAAILLRPRERQALAGGLRRAVADARLLRCPRSPAVGVARAAVCGCATDILALAAELCDPGVRPRGVALARRLLCDGGGPLYRARWPQELHEAVAVARAEL